MQTTWGRETIIPLPCAPEARLYHGLAVLQRQHHDRIISNFLNLWIARSFFSLGQTDSELLQENAVRHAEAHKEAGPYF